MRVVICFQKDYGITLQFVFVTDQFLSFSSVMLFSDYRNKVLRCGMKQNLCNFNLNLRYFQKFKAAP